MSTGSAVLQTSRFARLMAWALLAAGVAACAPDAPEGTAEGGAGSAADSPTVSRGAAGVPGGGSVVDGDRAPGDHTGGNQARGPRSPVGAAGDDPGVGRPGSGDRAAGRPGGGGGIAPDTADSAREALPPDSTLTFEGAWFEVAYPADFTVRPSLESSSAEGYDSAFFDSPEGEVTFYVFSPQWGGEPTDIAPDPGTEVVQDSTSTTEGPITTTRVTIRARDGSWERSYVTEEDERGPSRWTIGWRYSSQEARERFAPVFEAFRESLTQFGD